MSDSPIKENRIVQIATLAPHPRNYRAHPKHQIDQLALSLQRFGQGRSIVVQDSPEHMIIVAGHGIVEAAQALEWQELRADILPADWTDSQIEGYLIADNLHSQEASDNEELLAMLLQEQQDAGYDLASLGTDDETLRQMLEGLGDSFGVGGGYSEGAGGDDFDTTPEEGPTRTHSGELWQLGRHRLLVGDSTKREDVERLLDSVHLQSIITSPPYGVGMEYEGDATQTEIVSLARDTFAYWCPYVKQDGFAFVNFGERWSCPKPYSAIYVQLFQQLGWRWYDLRFWKRSSVGLAIWNTTQPHAMSHVEHLFTFQNGRSAYPVHDLSISKEQLWDDVGSSTGSGHPAVMAIGVATKATIIYSDVGDKIGDPFLGSGTTLIACERLGRICYGMEIEPRYCDVILRRYEAETGQTATLLERVEVAAHV
jgi:DNA modification methylase